MSFSSFSSASSFSFFTPATPFNLRQNEATKPESTPRGTGSFSSKEPEPMTATGSPPPLVREIDTASREYQSPTQKAREKILHFETERNFIETNTTDENLAQILKRELEQELKDQLNKMVCSLIQDNEDEATIRVIATLEHLEFRFSREDHLMFQETVNPEFKKFRDYFIQRTETPARPSSPLEPETLRSPMTATLLRKKFWGPLPESTPEGVRVETFEDSKDFAESADSAS
jgi:hypothetical protein